MSAPQWFVDWRAIFVLCLLAIASILLAAKSGIDDRRAIRRIRRADAIIDSLTSGRWVQLRDGDTVVTVVRANKWPFQVRH